MLPLSVPRRLAASCRTTAAGRAWLQQLPDAIHILQTTWSLALGAPFAGDDVSCAWVAPASCSDGRRAVLKLGLPHFEATHEIQALRFWDGDPTVRLLAADEQRNALLLERCEPGTPLHQLPEPEQDRIVAALLRRLWRVPAEPHPFRPLAAMTALWVQVTRADAARWPDVGLVQAGLQLFEDLPRTATSAVLLATDLHAGNVLRAQRAPWLVIDPKPFVGDPAYDATQHLFNGTTRLHAQPHETIRRVADLLEVDAERVRLWMFARAAAEPRDRWDDDSVALARLLA